MIERQAPKGAWAVAGMLFAYMLINVADKAVVGLAAVPIMRAMELSAKQFGLLGPAFFLLFSISGAWSSASSPIAARPG